LKDARNIRPVGDEEAVYLKKTFEGFYKNEISCVGKSLPQLSEEQSGCLITACFAAGCDAMVNAEVYITVVKLTKVFEMGRSRRA
jgi:hypothetical protein